MNAVEIEQAITVLAEQPFDPATFPYAFLEAFGNKETTIKRLRAGASNKSDIGGILQTNNIHILTCEAGQVPKALRALKDSSATVKAKAKFILATDGTDFEAEDLASGETVVCAFKDFPDHFGVFLPLAGITTVGQISDNAFDIRATSRLNRLYVELLRDNPEWGKAERRHDMNHFMARLIFCFFAEDTDIFVGKGKFTETVAQMSAKDSSNTHEVIGTLFLAMNTNRQDRAAATIPRWADDLPYVNGGLFSGSMEVPRFSKIARSYLLHVGGLDWTKINPDIFGSMIQAVAEDEERGELGMHYTSVPNILKVLNPLFLDDLRARLEEAGDNPRTLLNLRKRMAKIRVFDPACGSGNFLVIAYKAMREIEAEINKRRREPHRRSEIPLTNFRGIELRDFSAEIARLALVIAEFQCDVLYRGHKLALAEFLPLRNENWITCGNALRVDWLAICPPTGKSVKVQADDLFGTPLDQAEIDFENDGGETYICGNPPFSGTRKQTDEQKADLEAVFAKNTSKWKNVDYVGAWLLKAALYNQRCNARFAFVATNSLCQGQQVPITWSILGKMGCRIRFAHTSFVWSNLAKNRAGVTVIIVGVDFDESGTRIILTGDSRRTVAHITPYLTEHRITIVEASRRPLFLEPVMDYGVYYSKSAGLILDPLDKEALLREGFPANLVKSFLGSTEFINGEPRYCLWLSDDDVALARSFPDVASRIDAVRADRLATEDRAVNKLATRPHQFRERKGNEATKIFVPIVSSENREYFPVGLADGSVIPTNKAFYMGNCPLWCLSIIASRLHLAWIAAICGRLRSDFSYSNTLGWNTFPLPTLTEKNKTDLTRCAEDILLAREHHFPATIADLYDPDAMPADLRAAHDRNDEVLERIYIGRRFKNDTERLEKLFDLYTKMTAAAPPTQGQEPQSESQRMSDKIKSVPSVSVTYARNGESTKANSFGMRPMQERAYEKRGEQYLLIKSPPASGKSRALMFVALDKLKNQGLKQAIIVVPERSIGASFNDEALSKCGFWADWHVEPKWNLCNAPGNDNGGKVKSLGAFLEGDDKVLVCTHATFRFAVHAFGVEAFDDRLIAIDEFHHVSASPDNRLGTHLGQFIARGRTHIVAMTGSYFRGDAEAVLAPSDEAKFDTVTYTYYEQLNGYEYLKKLDIGYFFYSGPYVDDILNVLDPSEKTIIHIPNVNSRESTKDKMREVEHIIEALGKWQGIDAETGFQLVKRPDGRVLRIADLVDDDGAKRDRVSAALREPAQKNNRDYVDIIIALGMAKEGFDWIWCEHALTVGYRASLTEIVQIIGRATRDAPGKTRARFTNLIAEPDASEEAVTEAVNDTLKAIAASLLMEQVLAPRFEFKAKNADSGPTPGFDYGEGGYDPEKSNVGVNHQTGQVQIEIKGLAEPKSKEATRICQQDLNEVIATFIQDKTAIERGLFDEELVPEELTQIRMGKIIKDRYPELDAEDQESVRQHAIAALTLTQQAKQQATGGESDEAPQNTALIEGVRRFAMNVRELDIDLIDRINPFGEAYAILAKTMSEESLKQVAAAISAKRANLTPDEAKELAVRAVQFKKERGRVPALDSQDAWERRMAEGAAAFMRYRKEGRYE